MSIHVATGSGFREESEAEVPLLRHAVRGSIDFKGRPAARLKTGRWKSACFIIGVELAERIAFFGINSNLISYLTGPLGQSTAAAAANANTWSGTSWILPLLGGFIADSCVGRYRMIIIASLFYILGLGLLSLSAALHSDASDCKNSNTTNACSSTQPEIIFFFLSLYLAACAQGGNKPCVLAFAADQFDDEDQEECKAKSSLFNWWNFILAVLTTLTVLVLNYIQDNLSWGLSFGIPSIFMCFALLVFLLGTMTYRFHIDGDGRSPIVSIYQVIVKASRDWMANDVAVSVHEVAEPIWPYEGSLVYYLFFNSQGLSPRHIWPYHSYEISIGLFNCVLGSIDVLVPVYPIYVVYGLNWFCDIDSPDGLGEDGKSCISQNVEASKTVLGLVSIWSTCLGYSILHSQISTLFVKQAATMERHITPSFQIPVASIQSSVEVAFIIFIPIYDSIFIPIARGITKKPAGISMLQRIGTGLFLSVVAMMIAALVERKRLAIALDHGVADITNAALPMSIWWLAPQYIVFGVADGFTLVGLQEFFYNQVPRELRSIGVALFLSIIGVGHLLSSFLVSVVAKVTSRDGEDGWISNDINLAHLDYFYWLLCGIGAFCFAAYLFSAKSYVYRASIAV